MHVCDLGDEHRAQDGAHTGQLLDRLLAGVPDELVGDHDAEPGFVCIQGVDELQQRDHPLHVGGPQRHVSQALASADPNRSLTAINTPALASTARTWAFSPERKATILAR